MPFFVLEFPMFPVVHKVAMRKKVKIRTPGHLVYLRSGAGTHKDKSKYSRKTRTKRVYE